jgi:hypothetical protein
VEQEPESEGSRNEWAEVRAEHYCGSGMSFSMSWGT